MATPDAVSKVGPVPIRWHWKGVSGARAPGDWALRSLLGLHNRVAQVGALNNRGLFSHSAGGCKRQVRDWRGWFLVRAVFLACR